MKSMEEDPELLQNYFKAVENKEKLINFDKTDVARKNVYDGDTDWYELKNDVWQDDTTRNEALKNMMALEDEEDFARNNEKIDIDFMTGEINELKIKVDYKKHKQDVDNLLKKAEQKQSENTVDTQEVDERMKKKERDLLDGLKESYKEQERKAAALAEVKKWKDPMQASKKIHHDDCYDDFQKALSLLDGKRIGLPEECFDKPLYKLNSGAINCLSMWQPWASLVIYGFKRFEGRAWNTDYKGPLWIHSGSK